MDAQCPHCQRVIYSRRHKSCGFCGKALPAELLLTPEELTAMNEEEAKVKAELDALKKERDRVEREANAAMIAGAGM